VVTIRTASLTFNSSTFCPHTVFMCFVWISEQTAIISLYNINWLVFITQTQCVYCAVRTGSLNVIPFVFLISEALMLWWFWQPAKKHKYLAERCWFQPAACRLFISPFIFPRGNREINFLVVWNSGQRFFFLCLVEYTDWLTDWLIDWLTVWQHAITDGLIAEHCYKYETDAWLI